MTPRDRPRRAVSAGARRAVRRLVGRLPAPRDEAALGMLRQARALVTGTPPPVAKPAPAKRPRKTPAPPKATPKPPATIAATAPLTGGVPGRWIRVVHEVEPEKGLLDREVDDPTEAAAVRSGWLLVDAHERLSGPGAMRVFGHENRAWLDYAEDTLVELEHHEGAGQVPLHESCNNRLRYRRTMDFARRGDKVFDVGFGQGYLAAQLIRGCGVASYDGIDVLDSLKPRALRLFEANGLEEASIDLQLGDLFDLTRERLEAVGATLVICCEVLEHVGDAERALCVLADALPEGADLVFSVPLHGRLENVWGHVSVFDVARLKGMLDGAGLFAHHVEPLANAWTLVVASRDPARSTRVRQARSRPPVRVSVPLVRERDFVNVLPDDVTATPRGAAEVVVDTDDERGVRCRLTGSGGVSFPVRGVEALRLVFVFSEAQQIRRFVVRTYAGSRRTGEWTWVPAAGALTRGKHSFSLRPGQWSTNFVSGVHAGLGDSDRVDVVAEVEQGTTARFALFAAYLP